MNIKLMITLITLSFGLLGLNAQATGQTQLMSSNKSPAHAANKPAALDEIVVVVNDDVITSSDIRHIMKITKQQLAHENASLPSEAALKTQIIEQLIDKKLQLQLAKQNNIVATPAELEKTIQSIAKQNGVSVKALYQRVEKEGMSVADYRRELSDQLMIQTLQQREVVRHVSVTPKDIDQFLSSKTWQQHDSAAEYRLEDVLISLADEPSPAQIQTAKSSAESLAARLNKGASIDEALKSEPKSRLSIQREDLGFRKLAEIPSAFAQAVSQLPLHGIAGPIQTPNGFHILRLTEIKQSAGATLKPTREQVRMILLQRKFETAVKTWLSKIRQQAYIINKSSEQS